MSGAAKPVATPADSASKLPVIMKPFMEEFKKDIIAAMTASNLETQQMIQNILAQLNILEKLVAGEKKKAVAKPKVADGAAAPADGPPAPAGAKFAANKLIWFRSEFKNEAFRAKYVTPVIADLIEKDPTIANKKGESAMVAKAAFCWNWIKNNDAAKTEQITAEFNEAAKAFEASQKAIQVAEPHSDEAAV